jgi:hypothetical protein
MCKVLVCSRLDRVRPGDKVLAPMEGERYLGVARRMGLLHLLALMRLPSWRNARKGEEPRIVQFV